MAARRLAGRVRVPTEPISRPLLALPPLQFRDPGAKLRALEVIEEER